MIGLASTSRVQELEAANGASLCWLRATCDECELAAASMLRFEAHWAMQVIGWRLASTDGYDEWAWDAGLAVAPAADPATSNAS